MEKRIKTITLSGKAYPYKCSNYVLAQIQEEYGTITEFERKLSGRVEVLDDNGEPKTTEDGKRLFKKTEPSMKALNFALPLMIEEGLRIESDRKKKEMPDTADIISKIDMNPFELANIILEEFYRSLAIKK